MSSNNYPDLPAKYMWASLKGGVYLHRKGINISGKGQRVTFLTKEAAARELNRICDAQHWTQAETARCSIERLVGVKGVPGRYSIRLGYDCV